MFSLQLSPNSALLADVLDLPNKWGQSELTPSIQLQTLDVSRETNIMFKILHIAISTGFVSLALLVASFAAAMNLSPEDIRSIDVAALEAYSRGDFPVAFSRFLPDAKSGNAWSMYFVGLMFQNGEGVPKSYDEATRWMLRSAEKGNSEAMANLGKVYAEGLGVTKDFSSSLKWYKLAASRGNETAMFSLALAYANGQGIPKNFSAAAGWFKACAEAGTPICMVSLATYLKSGIGVEKNLVMAYAWFNVAAAKHFSLSDVAAHGRDDVGRELSPEQLSRAQALSLKLATGN